MQNLHTVIAATRYRVERQIFVAYVVVSVVAESLAQDTRHVVGWVRFFVATTR